MNKKIKFIPFILSFVIVFNINAFAINDSKDSLNEKEIVNEVSFSDNCETLSVSRKLEISGVPTQLQKIVQEKEYDALNASTKIISKTNYYVCSPTGSLCNVTKQYHDEIAKRENKNLKESIESAYKNYGTKQTIESPGITASVNNGTLTITVLLVTSDNFNFTSIAAFSWDSLPTFRGTDIFGLALDTNVTINAQSASAVYDLTYLYSYMDGVNYIQQEKYSTQNISYSDLCAAGDDGYAFEYDLPIDTAGESYPYYSIYYTNIMGALSCTGYVTYPNCAGLNQWGVYAHQKLSLTFGGIDFSVPFSTGFSVGFNLSYTQKIAELTWTRY